MKKALQRTCLKRRADEFVRWIGTKLGTRTIQRLSRYKWLEEVILVSRKFDVVVEKDSESFIEVSFLALPGCLALGGISNPSLHSRVGA